jgi:histidine triad (HIT) family protein
MADCLFCQLLAEKKLDLIYEDDRVVAFPDIEPKAPIHLLLIPRKHISSVAQLEETDETILGHLFTTAKQIAADKGVTESGFRLVVNTGGHAGQTVHHIHMHLLASEPLKEL